MMLEGLSTHRIPKSLSSYDFGNAQTEKNITECVGNIVRKTKQD